MNKKIRFKKAFLIRRAKKLHRNFLKRKYKKYNVKDFSYVTPQRQSHTEEETINAPSQFNLKYENCVDVIKFINDVKKKGRSGKRLFFNLKDIEDIGEGAISMLLSVLSEPSLRGVFIRGNKPQNTDVNNTLERSGFFKYFRTILSEENQNSKNTILRTGTDRSDHSEIVKAVRKSCETVWGVEARFPMLYGGIVEMVRNSCDHAFQGHDMISWHLGLAHFEDSNSVKFSFVDNGKGIISSFKKGSLSAIFKMFESHSSIIKTAFEDGIESKTGLKWRGKGLPTIFEMYTSNIIKNLIVITNDVYIDFDQKIYVDLPARYKGTYYFWVVNKDCNKNIFIN
jgi:ribosomal protein S8